MAFLGWLTPERARALGVPDSSYVISPMPRRPKKPTTPTSSSNTTTGTSTPPARRTGIVSRGAVDPYSQEDSAVMSFGYFRTKSGLPPAQDQASSSASQRATRRRKQ